jgi:RNA polymerase sigma-70 factor (ECF subfamily)
MNTQQTTDYQLIQQLKAGNDAAFEELLSRYKKPVLNFVYRLLGNADDADDVAQEVFVRAYRHIEDYRPKTQFSTWLFAIARNAAIDRLRHRQRHPTEPLEGIEPASPVRGPAAEAQLQEIGAQIASAIQQLPEDQRTAIVLAEYHDQSHAEIAAIMGCSEKSVESRLYRARQTLRRALAPLFPVI